MNLCPDCRTPIMSLMFVDGNTVPTPHCERCCKSVNIAVKPVAVPREKVPA